MFLKEFTSREMQREGGMVQDAALIEPVVINRQKREGTVLMSKKHYAELVRKAQKADMAANNGN